VADPQLLERWLAARDAPSIRTAWKALAPTVRDVGTHRLTREGAVQLAFAMVGDRHEWLLKEPYTADFENSDTIVPEVFVDHGWDIDEQCRCYFKLWEKRDGVRGVQLLRVGCGSVSGQPDGAELQFVRIFDRERAVSVQLDSTKVATIGEVDLAPLDLVRASSVTTYAAQADVGTVRGLMAQVAADVDAHYDTSTQWPAVDAADVDVRWWGEGTKAYRFADGGRAVVVIDDPQRRRIFARLEGMSWGHAIELDLWTSFSVSVTLPAADAERVLARFNTLGRSQLHP
jgi:hypothetical protein